MLNTLGPSWMPAPISRNSGACSRTLDLDALARERQRGGKPADAAADDDDRLLRHPRLLRERAMIALRFSRRKGRRDAVARRVVSGGGKLEPLYGAS